MEIGLDRIIKEKEVLNHLEGRVGYLCHSASVSQNLQNGVDILADKLGQRLTCIMGPQHGFNTDLQDNMIESPDSIHPLYRIPVFSLYGETRVPTDAMLDHFDTLVIDLQDVGTRVYTYIWTMFFSMKRCSEKGKRVVILDRPNPVGGVVTEGNLADPAWFSFVCQAPIPMRHGLTIGELAQLFKRINNWNLDLQIIKMKGWRRDMLWRDTGLSWINPSPNLPTPEGALVYPGTVMVEGTLLSEGRGTTRSLEIIGHPDMEPFTMHSGLTDYLNKQNLSGFHLRPILFSPTFHKFKKMNCGGFQIHPTDPLKFRPWRTVLFLLKYIHNQGIISPFWNRDPYEYEFDGLAFDWIHGTDKIREWVEDREAGLAELIILEKENFDGFKYLSQQCNLY